VGLIDHYESIIANVGYEYIEDRVLKTCTGEWAKPILEDLRVWKSEKVVPWMLHVYARGASNRTCYFLFFLMSYNVSDDKV
jgi:anaphase-promoting complex subunit 2